jgi:hypothetical protein
MICEICHGKRGWWVGKEDDRRVFLPRWGAVRWEPCPACVGGVASCCEGAVGGPGDVTNQGEVKRDG